MKKLIVRLVVGLGLLGFILTRVDLSGLSVGSVENVVLGLLAATGVILVNQFLSALRWKLILAGEKVSLGYLCRLYLVGTFFSTFLPTSVGGDAVRTVAAAQAMEQSGVAVSSVVLDRMLGLAAMGVYLLLGAWLTPDLLRGIVAETDWAGQWWMWAAAAPLVLVGVYLLSRNDRIREGLRQAAGMLGRLRDAPGRLAGAVALSFLVQGLYIVSWIALAVAVGFTLPLELFLVAVPVVSLGAMLPVTLSGVGIREGLWLILLAQFDLASANVVAFSLLFFLAFALAGGVGGILFVLKGTAPDGTEQATGPGEEAMEPAASPAAPEAVPGAGEADRAPGAGG